MFRIAAFLTYFIFECSIHIHRKLFTSGGIGTVSRKALQPLRVETEENSLREFLVKSLSWESRVDLVELYTNRDNMVLFQKDIAIWWVLCLDSVVIILCICVPLGERHNHLLESQETVNVDNTVYWSVTMRIKRACRIAWETLQVSINDSRSIEELLCARHI